MKFSEICDYTTGKLNSNQAEFGGEYPFFTCSPEVLRINSYAFDQDAVLLAGNNANGVFHLKRYNGKFNAYQRTYVINSKNDDLVNNRFIFYQLSLKLNMLKGVSLGTATRFLTRTILDKIEFNLPNKSEMTFIADTLSCLDDKIDLNNRINKTLEEMAQAIFKSWFVDFEPFQDGEFEDSELGRIPKGWRVGTLGDIAVITMGQSPSGNSYNENAEGKVFYQGRTDFGKRYPTIRLYTTEPKRMADKGDGLLSVRAPVGDVNVASEQCCIGRGLAALKSKNRSQSFLLYQLLNLKESFRVYDGEGTVFGSINKEDLKNMRIFIPSENSIHAFQNVVGKIDEVIENNSNQIKTLTAIRDALLPKLMSGEIRVPIEEVQ